MTCVSVIIPTHNRADVLGRAVASVLALLALVTLVAKTLVEWQMRRETAMLDSLLPNEKTDQVNGKSL